VGRATSLWYYLPVMGTAVVCIDGLSKVLRKHPVANIAGSMLVLFAAMVHALVVSGWKDPQVAAAPLASSTLAL
jgi:hypothetical protein